NALAFVAGPIKYIERRIFCASGQLSARKTTHRLTTARSVSTCDKTEPARATAGIEPMPRLTPGANLLDQRWLITTRTPCTDPQMTKVHPAPCHKPVRKNTTMMYHTCFARPLRLPPSGM